MAEAARDTGAATTSAPTLDPGRSRAASDELARLYEAHARRVRLVCVSMLRDAHDADDALQQTFLSAYRSLLGGSVPREAEAWVMTIARNECRARIRERMATPLADVEVETFAGHADAADAAAEREQLAAVLAAVGALPDRERQAVVLQAFGGVSNAEVAVRLGTTESAVESILVRARAELRARAWPVVVGARALVLAPASWVRALLSAPGGTDVVAVAKVGTAMAVVGTLVTVGPSVGSHGNPARGPAPARAAVVAGGGAAVDVSALEAVVAHVRPTLPAPVVGAGMQRGRGHRAAAPPPVVARRAPAESQDAHDDTHGAGTGTGTAAAGDASGDDRGSSSAGASAPSGPSGDSGSGETPSSGSGSGPGRVDSGTGSEGSSSGSGSGSGTDDGTSGESSGSDSGSGSGSSDDGTGSSDGGSSGSGADDPSGSGASGSGSGSGSSGETSGSGSGSASGGGSGSSGGSGSGGGSGGSSDPATSTTGGDDGHH